MRRDIPGTTFRPHPCSRSACTGLAAVASLFLPLRCLSWHRQRFFPDPGTVSQLGTSSFPSSSCPFTRRPPRSISRRCKSGLDRLLPALLGPSVPAERPRASGGLLLTGRGPAHTARPRPCRCACTRGSGGTFPACSSPAVCWFHRLTFASAGPSARSVHLLSLLRLRAPIFPSSSSLNSALLVTSFLSPTFICGLLFPLWAPNTLLLWDGSANAPLRF